MLSKIKNEEELDVLITHIENATASNGNAYQRLAVKDLDGETARLTNFKEIIKPETTIVKLVIVADMYEGNRTYKVKKISPSTLKPEDFRGKAQVNQQEAWNTILSILKNLSDKALGKLVCDVIRRKKKTLLFNPLGANGSGYTRTSGTLEATCNLIELATKAAEILGLNMDMMIAGASLYYIYSDRAVDEDGNEKLEGVLLGKSILAYQEIAEEPSSKDVDATVLLHLEHIVACASKGLAPATTEAFVLKQLDYIVRESDNMKKLIDLQEEYVPVNNRGGKVVKLPKKKKEGGTADE